MKISLVMPSYNQAAFLPDAIQSILNQQGDFDLECIIIDGQSDDGSVEYLRSISDPRLTWLSEPDDGQSDAINKGMAKASGDILAWLNSDDLYLPGAFQAVVQGFTQHPQHDWLTGTCGIIDQAGQPIRSLVKRYKNRRLARYSATSLLRENYIAQPATFWRRQAWQRVGPLDTQLHWTMDYDLWLRLSRLTDPLVLTQELARFRLYQTSKTGSFTRQQYDEGYRVACRYADDAPLTRLAHRLNVEKIVLAYRLLKWLKR